MYSRSWSGLKNFKPDEDLQYLSRKFVCKIICSEEF